MGSDDILDILLLVFAIAVLTPIMLANAIPMFKGDVGGFDTLIEKTAQKTGGEIKPVERPFGRDDVLLMTIIADRKTPLPAVFQTATDGVSPEITINNILSQRAYVLQTLNSYITYNGPLRIQTYIGSGGMRKWVVVRR